MSARTLAALALAASLATGAFADAPRSPTPATIDGPVTTVEVARGLDHPWGLAFLPDGRMLVTERAGRLLLLDKDGRNRRVVTGTPAVDAGGQGGLLGIAVSPTFARDRFVYLSFSDAGTGGSGTAVARGVLNDAALNDVQVIWRQTPKISGSRNHWGSRLVFARDGTLFVTTGDRYVGRQYVQDLSTTVGKVVRINADGSIPKDNPFVSRAGAKPEIWSYGHRNLQGATLDPTGRLWTLEHGARGGDELNHPEAGKNYGWPVITYGVDYSGVKIGEGTQKAGMEQPVYFWDPVIAPSGMAFNTGDRYPGWKGDLFAGSLTPGALVRMKLDGDKVVAEERYLPRAGRVRDVVMGPDGYLYLLTDADDGALLRVMPR